MPSVHITLVGLVLDPTDEGKLTLIRRPEICEIFGHVHIRPTGQDPPQVACDVLSEIELMWPGSIEPVEPQVRQSVEDQLDEATQFWPIDLDGHEIVGATCLDPRCHEFARYQFNFGIVIRCG
jgi:hypothetical protein